MNTAPVCVSVDCPAKTNLTLHVGKPREQWDGKHEIDTMYCAISLADTLTATQKPLGTGFSLELQGNHLGDLSSADMRRNHAVLALFAMSKEAGREPDIALSIDKRIPVGAGLAGGSTDAAGTILALNELWELNWPLDRLKRVAATLGSDMPFCLTGGYAHGTGYGEQTEIIAPDCTEAARLRQQGYCGSLVVGAYRSQLSTPQVYAAFDQLGAGEGDDNHLQQAAISLHPRSGEAIAVALRAGAQHAFVSGSGPSVVAFTPTPAIRQAVIAAWQRDGSVDRIIAAEAPDEPLFKRHGCAIS